MKKNLNQRKIRHRDSGRSIGQDQFMHQGRYCTSKAITQFMIDFFKKKNLRRAQGEKLVFFIKNSSEATILYDNLPASALDKVVTFAGEVLFERKHPTSIKSEATPGDRLDMRRSCKSTMINDMIKKYSQKCRAVIYHFVSHRDSEIRAQQNGNLGTT